MEMDFLTPFGKDIFARLMDASSRLRQMNAPYDCIHAVIC